VDSLKVPSKTFLLGEYAILTTGKALLLGHEPYFHATFSPGNTQPFAQESPAGRWLQQHPLRAAIHYADPHGGRGGFGGSGAELLAAMEASVGAKDPWWIWEHSRSLGGSGADLLLQSYARNKLAPIFLAIDLQQKSLTPIPWALPGTFSIFHTGKKIPTHEHLAERPQAPESLAAVVESGILALQSGAATAFGEALNQTHQLLAQAGLQAPHTSAALLSLPRQGVFGAKGCGALGSDVILVYHQDASLESWARENSLALVMEFSV
jgi:hypothetical protein